MVLESYEIIGFAGIALEVFGFILMIKFYGKKPTDNNWQKWKTKNLVNKGFTRWEEKDVVDIEMAHTPKGATEPVHRGFVTYWNIRSKYAPLWFVIFGLVLQGIQLLVD